MGKMKFRSNGKTPQLEQVLQAESDTYQDRVDDDLIEMSLECLSVDPEVIVETIYVDRDVIREVPVDRIVEVIKIVKEPIEVIVERLVEVEKLVNVEKIVYIDRVVDKPIEIEQHFKNKELMKKLSSLETSVNVYKYITGFLLVLIIAGVIYGQ